MVNAATRHYLRTHNVRVTIKAVKSGDAVLINSHYLARSCELAGPVGVCDDVGDVATIIILLQSARLKWDILHLAHLTVKVVINVQGEAAIVGEVLAYRVNDVVHCVTVAINNKVIEREVIEPLTLDKAGIPVATLRTGARCVKYSLSLLRI